MTEDRRLIEDYLPIEAISESASSEPRMKGHISTLHVWRARRPLSACRVAVYGALVPASRFVPENGPDNKKQSLGRANAAKFVAGLCTYPPPQAAVQDAQRHIREAYEKANPGKGGRPRVLDMFAGGGAIPLEAARLGCEAHALELNPVAHIIELCTLYYPQHFGAELAVEVEAWGKKVLERTYAQVSDVMAHIPGPQKKTKKQRRLSPDGKAGESTALSVVAYYWTRTAPCPNPECKGTVPLYRQTWLRKKASGYVALKPVINRKTKLVSFEVVESESEKGLGFDPSRGSETSSTVCPFCQTTLEGAYVRKYGDEHGFGQQLMCVITLNPEGTGKWYLTDETLAHGEAARQAESEKRADILEKELGNSSLDQQIPPTGNAGLATGNSYLYGIKTFRQAFMPRQRLILLTLAREIKIAHAQMLSSGVEKDKAKAITTYLGLWLSRLTDRFNALARWHNARETIESITSMKRIAMMWDFPEVNIFGGASGDALGNLEYITAVIRQEGGYRNPVQCIRGSATELPFEDNSFDAVITDPPYYDYESYSELSDVCYVWLRPAIGFLYPEHFSTALTPKKKECVAAAYRQGGTQSGAYKFYEETLFKALKEANRITKDDGILVIVYAHKSTAGWATLVDALRRAGYAISEAWPLDTETKERVAHRGDAALASSIFLVARKREVQATGRYDTQVKPELESIVRERVETLWDMGITGADLVIACVGAGLQAFTRFSKVEYENGEEVPAQRFLAEVESVVLDMILGRLSREVAGRKATEGQDRRSALRHSLAGLDPFTRFYILWRYTYKAAELDPGEAIIFANGTHVELDGPGGLTSGARPLARKIKSKNKIKYSLFDYAHRGGDDKLGLPGPDGAPAPLIDALHRVLWLLENQPADLPVFLKEASPNLEQMRLVAQALVGPVLKGGELPDLSPSAELSVLGRLTANWRSVIEDAMIGATEKTAKKAGQLVLSFEKEKP